MRQIGNITVPVFQVWFETSMGPIFSSRDRAEKWLDIQYGDRGSWMDSQDLYGYPNIITLIVDDCERPLMKR